MRETLAHRNKLFSNNHIHRPPTGPHFSFPSPTNSNPAPLTLNWVSVRVCVCRISFHTWQHQLIVNNLLDSGLCSLHLGVQERGGLFLQDRGRRKWYTHTLVFNCNTVLDSLIILHAIQRRRRKTELKESKHKPLDTIKHGFCRVWPKIDFKSALTCAVLPCHHTLD